MEVLAFLAGVVAVSVFVLVRRHRSDDPEASHLDFDHDLRDKNTGMLSLPNRGRPSADPPISGSGFGGGGGAGGAGGTGSGGGGGGGGGSGF
ncbi:MAG TPA: hypothetical protein VJ850_07575 [Candidatus Limnocylindrales bacterium]|nr:hypothetical protein [Candidatus Limnocylindrales bacterium]